MTKKRVFHIGISVAMYLITGGMWLWLRFFAYRGALPASFLDTLLILVPILTVMTLIRSADGGLSNIWANTRVGAVFVWLCCVAIAFLLVEQLGKTRFYLDGWLYAVLLIVAGLVTVVPALHRFNDSQPLFFALLFAALLVAMLLFLAVMRPMTVRGAKQLVEQAGYQNAIYRTTWEGPHAHLITSHGILEPESLDENSWGYYWLSAQKGGEEYAVAVSVAEGRICAAEKQDGNAIQYW
ncbi:hypothetical protein RWV98_01755 [Agathobaculum sp. NTUH-O15-33]|uniref:hypothetical protein n=1 Tax=Agathobaculum sp. NTUH-O15-33 TaxID=3079302 RepID=UPI00295870B0|nr:hypothetical protein [Agathobaculum sp. NTUH-O15-33]WNX85024.1 hypothetical protein RWV98_01755 [Agathobaculum sp. NTUH-O15-33]